MKSPVTLFWFRRDLRLHDNAGFNFALRSENPVVPLFIFDTEILQALKDKRDKRVEFIHKTLVEMQKKLHDWGSFLLVKHGVPIDVWHQLVAEYNIAKVYTNNDYESYAMSRDEEVRRFLESRNIEFHSFCDQVISEKNDVLKPNGEPYTVFTPYKNAWKKKLVSTQAHTAAYPIKTFRTNFYKGSPLPMPTLKEINFEPSGASFPDTNVDDNTIVDYHRQRDIPGIQGTTRLGVHLRFGTVSVRDLVKRAIHLNETWLDELIWREFFKMILYFFPHVENRSFRAKYDNLAWRNKKEEFDRWRVGTTGYPMVDAGMRELNETGFMHNRLRMITAGFLTKHLLIDWRWGERYFAEKLLDYDLSANNGNWQWAAGTGCDAAPYFRIFNPTTQMQKFDPDLNYIKKWLPEFGTSKYPEPIVEHKFARGRAIETFAAARE